MTIKLIYKSHICRTVNNNDWEVGTAGNLHHSSFASSLTLWSDTNVVVTRKDIKFDKASCPIRNTQVAFATHLRKFICKLHLFAPDKIRDLGIAIMRSRIRWKIGIVA